MQTLFSFDQSSHTKDVNFCDYYWFKNAFSKEELAKIEPPKELSPEEKEAVKAKSKEVVVSQIKLGFAGLPNKAPATSTPLVEVFASV